MHIRGTLQHIGPIALLLLDGRAVSSIHFQIQNGVAVRGTGEKTEIGFKAHTLRLDTESTTPR